MSSFAAGLVLGQLSVVCVAALLLRFFLFSDTQAARAAPAPAPKVRPAVPDTLAGVLEHTYYNVETHKPESLDWFTLLMALNLNALRRDAVQKNRLLNFVNGALKTGLPPFLGDVRITELDLGRDYPLFNNCKVVSSTDSALGDGLEVQFDLDLKDRITIAFETQLLLNYPRPMVASLPVRASLSLVNLSGRVAVSVRSEPHEVTLQFAPDFALEFEVHSLLGARAQLCDVPKLGQMAESALRRAFAEQCVAPNFLRVPIPTPWAEPDDLAKAEKDSVTEATSDAAGNGKSDVEQEPASSDAKPAAAPAADVPGVSPARPEAGIKPGADVHVSVDASARRESSGNDHDAEGRASALLTPTASTVGTLTTDSVSLRAARLEVAELAPSAVTVVDADAESGTFAA